jgi:hypothetical protein
MLLKTDTRPIESGVGDREHERLTSALHRSAQLREHQAVRVFVEFVDDDDMPAVPIERAPLAADGPEHAPRARDGQRRYVALDQAEGIGEAPTILCASA